MFSNAVRAAPPACGRPDRARRLRQPRRLRRAVAPARLRSFARDQLGQQLDEHSTSCGIERASGLVLQQVDRALVAERVVIRPLRRDRVVVVDDRQNARADRNRLAGQSLRITLAVPSLVVAEDQRRDRIRKRHAGDDLRADLRMDADLLEFFRRQRPGLREDVLGHRELADVVQQRRGLDALDFSAPTVRSPRPVRPRRSARAGCASCVI